MLSNKMLTLIYILLIFCNTFEQRLFFNHKPYKRHNLWEVYFSQNKPLIELTLNVDRYMDWSNWTKCISQECIEIRHRNCSDDSWKENLNQKQKDNNKCVSKYLVEKRTCRDKTKCSVYVGSLKISNMTNNCGIRQNAEKKTQMKILGGKPSTPHSWPWMIRLSHQMPGSEKQISFCGATLIAPDWLITAAHCVLVENKSIPVGKMINLADYMKGEIKAHFGDHHKSIQEKGQIDQIIKTAIIHPSYHRLVQTDGYDIALLKLENSIDISPNINFACLPPPDLLLRPNTKCYALGWGKNVAPPKQRHTNLAQLIDNLMFGTFDFFGSHHDHDMWKLKAKKSDNLVQELHEVELPIMSIHQCNRQYYDVNPSLHICAGTSGKDTCEGDSGGGLYCKLAQNDQWFLVGVTSFGMARGCGVNSGVYTSVASHMKWIFKVVGSTDDNVA